ncbi:uncharacterized protein LOC118764607 isoform X4 [Octopus sinensis]|uniref:Uncharacterized protein LOC118764607 isoform X4 n=1 Tax=Octopus sinensis TaxID=2607531 RepID=A0A7E6F2A5_9MOLL|nr:uncharacterized protein LOC118764607 isoform X4 [Octopus sinensis]
MEQVLPLFSPDLLTFLTYPVPINSTFNIPFLTMQVVINCILLTSYIFDMYINFIMGFILKYEFEKLASQAQRYLKEQQPHISILAKKPREITDLCNAHENLSAILELVNESLRFITGYIVLGSIISSCIATYGIINESFKNNGYIYTYTAIAAFSNMMFWIITLWHGVRLHAADIKPEVVAKILVFLNRLTTESHGIDVGGCFVITPSSTLTMIGSFITYILVVIQTKSL